MSINNITSGLASLRPMQRPQPIIQNKNGVEPGAGGASGESFENVLVDAVREVESMQQEADKKIESLMTGKGGVTTHDAMIALEKADLAFQLMNQVRSKIMRAYEEVIRTQV